MISLVPQPMMTPAAQEALRDKLISGAWRCIPPRIRKMRQFANEEIVIPDGRFEGRRYNTDRQPYSRLWLDLVDSGLWNRFFATGPTQSGKTLSCFIIPTLYHLFEVQETVICAVPQMEMARDKWNEDLLPAIEKSRYRELLPTKGGGSKGGAVESVRFRNGVTLKFMSGGGNDKKRAAFTSRIVVITEVDGMDQAGEASREADKITQIEARTLSYGSLKRIYGECTVSIEEGRTWKEYTGGTETRIAVPCHDCHGWVTPEREDLFGWNDAPNVIEARSGANFTCPSCGVLWSDRQRRTANENAIALHRGQTMEPDGIVGDRPQTGTLGFRWNAFNNMFWDTADIAADEWEASRSENSDNAEKEQLQFKWAKPYKPDIEATVNISASAIMARTTPLAQGLIPRDTLYLTAGMDLGMYWNHWVLLAFRDGGTPHVVDYGAFEVRSPAVGVERATAIALQEFRDVCEYGWANIDGSRRSPDRVLIDSGYQTHEVYAFTRDFGAGRYWAVDGIGMAQDGGSGSYHAPTSISGNILHIGENYHIEKHSTGMVIKADANEWKTWAHKRLTTPIGQPGAMTLFQVEGRQHEQFAKHLTSEQAMDKWIPLKGLKTIWEKKQKKNHWFDALYYACVGGHWAGARLFSPKPVVVETKPTVIEEPRTFVRKIETINDDGGWIRRRNK